MCVPQFQVERAVTRQDGSITRRESSAFAAEGGQEPRSGPVKQSTPDDRRVGAHRYDQQTGERSDLSGEIAAFGSGSVRLRYRRISMIQQPGERLIQAKVAGIASDIY